MAKLQMDGNTAKRTKSDIDILKVEIADLKAKAAKNAADIAYLKKPK